jgi:hypothetical protein
MANKKVSQLVAKPSVLVTDLFPIADPTTGQLYKTTISDLGTAIGSGVSSVNTLVGAVVLDTDDIQELASPTNRWFTDTRARAALSASSPLAYNSGTGVFSIPAATSSQNGYLTSTDWTTFNAKQAALSGTGFVKISGTTISYDNSTYLTTSAAASTYLALAGGTLTGALNGTSANFSGDLTLTGTNPRFYLTDSDNNPDYFISNTDGTFTVYDVTNSTSRFTIGTTGNGTFGGNLTVGQIIRSGGTSAQFLKADGSIDSSTYLTTGTAASTYLALAGGTLTGAVTGTRLTLVQNSADIALSIVQSGTGLGLSVLGKSYFSSDISFGSLSSGILKANALGALVLATAGTDYQAPLSGTGFVKISGSTISYDNSTYLTTSSASSTYLALAGGTLTGALNGTSAVFTSTVRANNPAEGATGEGLIAGQSFKIDGTGTSQKAVIYLVSNVLSDTYASGLTAQFANFAGDKGFGFNLNTSGGYEVYVKNSTWNKALTIANTGAATFSNKVTTTGPANDWGLVVNGSTTLGQSYGANIIAGSNSSDVAFLISNYVGGDILRVIGTGAATFSSSVTATSVRLSDGNEIGWGANTTFLLGDSANNNFRFFTNNTEKVRITSAGNVGIGTTAPSFPLTVGQAGSTADSYIQIASTTTGTGNIFFGDATGGGIASYSGYIQYQHSVDAMVLATSSTERMRITSDGFTKMSSDGTYFATGSYHEVRSTNTTWTQVISNKSASPYGLYISYPNASPNVTGDNQFIWCDDSTNSKFIVWSNGNVVNRNNSYGAISDIKFKENISDATSKLSDLLKVKVRNYNLIGDSTKQLGVIAQELEEVFPNMVEVYKEKDSDEISKSVKYSVFVPMLIKAVQELKAELDTLKNK